MINIIKVNLKMINPMEKDNYMRMANFQMYNTIMVN